MTILFVILLIIASVVLGLLVLIQNPKGGGLAGNIAGFSTQFMGVKQTTDVLEKGTWIFAALIAILSITSSVFIGKATSENKLDNVNPNAVQQQPQQTAPASNNSVTFPAAKSPDTLKK